VYADGQMTFEETRLVLAIVGTAFIYWLAHLHARTVGDAVKHQKPDFDQFGWLPG
jgi:hypothetical protein